MILGAALRMKPLRRTIRRAQSRAMGKPVIVFYVVIERCTGAVVVALRVTYG